MTSRTGTRRLVISMVLVPLAGITVAAAMLTSGPTASSTPSSSVSPTMSADMPGMDHGFGDTPAVSPSPTASTKSPWKTHDDGASGTAHDHGTTAVAAPDRPLAAVLGTFGGGTSAVLLSAGFLRNRDRARRQEKAAARAARRSQQ